MNNENDEIAHDHSVIADDVTPKDLLNFARQILMCLTILFLLSWVADWLIPGRGIIDCCKTVAPSIATLVIGYYFGKTN